MTLDEQMMHSELLQLEGSSAGLTRWELEFICEIDSIHSNTILSDWQSKKLNEIWMEKMNGGQPLLPPPNQDCPSWMRRVDE